MEKRYSTHVVELVRNSGVAKERRNSKKHQCFATFFMFDYFDVLYYKQLTEVDKRYLDYFTIIDTFETEMNYKVSNKSLSLYKYAEDNEMNPFTYENSIKNSLSNAPFIGLIQISLCRENFQDRVLQKSSVDEFLEKCEEEIWNIVARRKDEDKAKIVCSQLYRSSTTGDFCLVLRTDCVAEIYKIALELSDTQSDPKADIRMITYTSVGIECRKRKDDSYCTLDEDFIKAHEVDIAFAIRFSADNMFESALKKYEMQYEDTGIQPRQKAVRGLFGRYDYLVNIDLREFADVYPMLCERKLGNQNHTDAIINEEDMTLKGIIGSPGIRNLNERILVDLPVLGISSHEMTNDEKNKIICKNECLFDRIWKMNDWRKIFSQEYRAFQDLYRGMKEIYKAFSALGMEKDAYINWLIFHRDMDILCSCLEKSIEEYRKIDLEDKEEQKEKRLLFLQNWRVNLQALNQYTRLVQNVNYQTYQAPIYEIQTQIDTEKTIVAYREVMEYYLQLYAKRYQKDLNNRDTVIPIVYPDLSKSEVSVASPFLYSGHDDAEKREIVCTVPSFEYFGRMYDLLPWILHESSHQIRMLDRKSRNKFVVNVICTAVFRHVIHKTLAEHAKTIFYNEMGCMEGTLLQCMTQEAEEEIFRNPRGVESGFEELRILIASFFQKFFSDDDCINEIYVNPDTKEAQKQIKVFFLDELRKENVFSKEDITCLEKIDQWGSVSNASGKLQSMIEKLLKAYNEKFVKGVSEKTGKCCLLSEKDLFVPITWLEKKISEMKYEAGEINKVKEYIFSVRKLHRVVSFIGQRDWRQSREEGYTQRFLEGVFKRYQTEQEKKNSEDMFFLTDAEIMYIWRSMGLLDKNKELFVSQTKKAFQASPWKQIQAIVNYQIDVYREVCADLCMVTSLGLSSFGYCRQVLQTISDAQLMKEAFRYDSVNFERFRIVIAMLLCSEGVKYKKGEVTTDIQVQVSGNSLIKKGIIYCKYTLKCIEEKIVKAIDKEENREPGMLAEKKKLVREFIEKLNKQIAVLLERAGNQRWGYRETLLYVLLHGKKNGMPETLIAHWDKYKELEDYCQDIKYIFWRLECFLKGVNSIFQEGYIYIPYSIFKHMAEIQNKIKDETIDGCVWEKAKPDWLKHAELDVGRFYNDPKLVFEMTAQQKLENTIDFIQNYYYFNRFRAIEEMDNK